MINMTRNIPIILYRTKLRLCRQMGYTYGKWSNSVGFENNQLRKRHFYKLDQNGYLGHCIWNAVRLGYKESSLFSDDDRINEEIDIGFDTLRHINVLFGMYKEKQMKLLTYK